MTARARRTDAYRTTLPVSLDGTVHALEVMSTARTLDAIPLSWNFPCGESAMLVRERGVVSKPGPSSCAMCRLTWLVGELRSGRPSREAGRVTLAQLVELAYDCDRLVHVWFERMAEQAERRARRGQEAA